MAENPRWTFNGATPAAVGTPEARTVPQSGAPQWTFKAPGPGFEQVSWTTLTGQNMEGTHNAFDTTFWETARKQDEESATQGLGQRWSRPDATGVVLYNDEKQGLRFGDVWLDGQKQGNLREGYAGFTKEQSNEILARIALPREVWAKAYETEAGRPLTWAKDLDGELARVERENTEAYAKGLSARAFEEATTSRARGLEESGAAQVANVGTGIGGGALVGASLGSLVAPGIGTAIGGGLGALAGGLGAWLNRDEQFTRIAQAQEQFELAKEQGSTIVGFADAISGWGGVAMGVLNPSRNLLRGAWDALDEEGGGAGDQRSRYNNEDAPLWFDAIDTAALLVDGIGSFGSAAARRVFTSFMGATATGSTASVVAGVPSGNIGFNPYSGQYEDLGAGGMALRGVSAGIDWLQTAAGSTLINRASNFGRTGSMADVQGGFRITTDAAGHRVTQGIGFSAAIPSEAATGISARMLARRSLRRKGEAMTPEALARETAKHIDNLTAGRKPIATMAVNAFGEGGEEFVQAALDAASVGEVPTMRELVQAYRQGAAMGAGMGAAVASGSRSRSDLWRERSNVIRAITQDPLLTDEQWDEMTDQQRALEGTAPTAETQRLVELMVKEWKAEGGRLAAANIPELRRASEIVLAREQERARNSQDTVETSRMSTRSNMDWAPQDYVISLGAAIRDITMRERALRRIAEGREVRRENGQLVEVTGFQREYAERVAGADAALLGLLERVRQEYEQAVDNGDPERARELIGGLNEQLRAWWSAKEDTDELAYGKRRSASIWGARFPLNSAGSFQLLRLQISPELTMQGTDYAALVPDEVQPPTGGDYDGDRFVNLLREILPDESYERLRRGAGQLTTDGTMLKAKPYVEAGSQVLFEVLKQQPGSGAHQAGTETLRNLSRVLHEILDQAPMDPRDRDALIADTVNKLATRRAKKAFGDLFTTLATRHADSMNELAATLDDSPWLMLNRAIEKEMDALGTRVALTDYWARSTTGATELPATPKDMPKWSRRPAPAPSEMLTAAIETNSWNFFRVQTILKYNPYRENTIWTEEDQQQALAALYERFTAMNDGLVRSGDLAQFEGTIVQDRAVRQLRRIADEQAQVLGVTPNEALVLMAAARVPDVEASRRQLRSKNLVMLSQVVLHDVVTDLRSEYAPIMGSDPSIAQRLGSLDALTRPDVEQGTHTSAVGGSAFVELLGSLRIAELLSAESAVAIQSYTVRGLRDRILELRGDVRKEFVASLKAHPHYSQDAGPLYHTPYRVLIDTIVESANMELSETDDGLAQGFRARAEQRARQNFQTMHDKLTELARARNYELSGTREQRAAQMRKFLNDNPARGVEVLRVMESRGLEVAITTEDAEGNTIGIQFPQWIYDVLAEPQTAKAEMLLLRHTLRMTKAAATSHGDNGKLEVEKEKDRILRLWMDLDFRAQDVTNPRMVFDRAARNDFMKLLEESETVDYFLSRLNKDPRFRREVSAPFMAWDRDRSTVEADRFGRGISDVPVGQDVREALQDAADAAVRELQIISDTERYLKHNAEQIDLIRASRDEGLDPVPWQRFQLWYEQVRDLPNLLSMSLLIEQAGHINEILHGMGVKGQAPSNVEAMGRAIAAQLPTFDSAVGRMLASITSASANSVLSDMTQLAHSDRTIVLNDGTVVKWERPSASEALDMLGRRDTAGFAARMLGLTAWDLNSETGVSTITSALGQGVAGFALDPAEALFGSDQASMFRRLMMVEGKATVPGGPPMLAVQLALQMNMRETAAQKVIDPNTDERQRMAVSILEDLATVGLAAATLEGGFVEDTRALTPAKDDDPSTEVKDAGGRYHPSGTGQPTTVLNRALLRAARRARRTTGNVISRMVNSLEGPAREIGLDIIEQFITRTITTAYREDDAMKMAIGRNLQEKMALVDSWLSPAELLVDRFKHYDRPETRAEIMTMLNSWGDVSNAVPWAREEILQAKFPRATVERSVIEIPGVAATEQRVTLPDMTDAQWETLARAVIAYTLHSSYGIAATSNMQIAEFPSLSKPNELEVQLPYWDPSMVSPVMDFLAPGVLSNPMAPPSPWLQGNIDLVKEMQVSGLPTVSELQLEDAVYRLFAPLERDTETGEATGTRGAWHALLPAQMHAAVGAVMSSSAPVGISMVGKSPQRLRFMGVTTQMDWSRQPSDDELSEAVIPVTQLVAATSQQNTLEALDSPITVKRALPAETGATKIVQAEGRLIELEGRVARTVQLVAPDGTVLRSLLGDSRFAPGFAVDVLPAGLGGVVSLETTAVAVTQLLREARVPKDQWDQYSLRMSYFDPVTKTVSKSRVAGTNYDHNAWFDGLAGRTKAALSQGSLMGFLFYGLTGMVPAGYETALSAIKKLLFALQQVTTMNEKERNRLYGIGVQDMVAMVGEMSRFLMKQKIDGDTIPSINYNAMRKLVELMFVIRYVDADGAAHVLSAEDAIAWQLRNGAFPEGSQAEVVGLPMEHILALMGEKDLSDETFTVFGVRDYRIDMDRAQPYVRFPEEAWTEMFPGLVARDDSGAWATRELLKEPGVAHMSLPRASMRHFDRQPALTINQDPWLPWRKEQERVLEQRRNSGLAGTFYAAQRETIRDTFAQRSQNAQYQTAQAVQALLEGRHLAAAQLKNNDRSTEVASHDLTTGWWYVTRGALTAGVQHGVLRTAADISSQTTLGDVIHVRPEEFLLTGVRDGDSAQERLAFEMLDAAMGQGVTIHIPVALDNRAVELRRKMVQHLRQRNYSAQYAGGDEFSPAVRELRSQTEEAYHSTLRQATHRTAMNRVVVDLSDLGSGGANENAIWSVNGGIGALENYFVREVYQTARYAGYTPPATREQELAVITRLLPLLQSEAGRNYLFDRSQYKRELSSQEEARRDLQLAIDRLVDRLKTSRDDKEKHLIPVSGDEFGTGDLIPLVSYNSAGELVGLHLYRHGHEPVSERDIRNPELPEGNLALGVEGARLTIDKGTVDAMHTTHRGVLVDSDWLGMQGFVARVRVKLDDFGSKIFESGAGMKWTTAPPPKGLAIPSRPLFAGQPVRGVADEASPAAKNSDQEWLNTVSNTVEVVGFNTMPYLVRALYGVDYRRNDPEYQQRENDVRLLLRSFSARFGDSAKPEDLVQNDSDSFEKAVLQMLQQRLRELLADEAPDLLEDGTQQRIADLTMLRLVLSALSSGARLYEVLGAPGYIGRGAADSSHTMHPVFTTLLDRLPADHPAFQAYVQEINTRMEETWDPRNGDGYSLAPSGRKWIRRVTRSDGSVMQIPVMLAFTDMRNTDHNDALSKMADARKQKGSLSPTTLAMAHVTWGAEAMVDERKIRALNLFGRNPMLHGSDAEILRRTLQIGRAATPFVGRMDDDLPLNAAALRHLDEMATPARKALSVLIDQERWYKDLDSNRKRTMKRSFDDLFAAVRNEAKLLPNDDIYLHEMIRAAVARPARREHPDGDFITYNEAMAALKLIQNNLRRHDWPVHGGAAPVITRDALDALRRAGYLMRAGDGKVRPLSNKWDDWVDLMLSEVFSDDPMMRGYPAVANIVDGVLHEYRKDVKGLPPTTNPTRAAILRTVSTLEGNMLVASPYARRAIDNYSVQGGQAVMDPRDFYTESTMLDELPQEARSLVEKRMKSWEERNGLGGRRRMSPRAEVKRGAQVREDHARTNTLMRFAQLGVVLKTMVNLGLHVSAYLELAVKGAQERMVSFLNGDALPLQGFTPEQRRQWRDTRRVLARHPEFYAMIFNNTNWNPNSAAETKWEHKIQNATNFLTAMYNDPTWGQRGDAMANAFMEAAWDAVTKSDTFVSPEQFLDTLASNPAALEQISVDAVKHGYSRVEYRRNLQDNLAERTRRWAVEGIINGGGPMQNSLGVLLLRFPTLFFRFRSNTIINLMGLQAPHALLTTLLSDRTKRAGGLKDHLLGDDQGQDPEITDQARIEDSMDMTRAIIRSGVSHTQLFLLGSMLSAAGFGGDDDDEERFLNKLRRYQTTPVAKDPMALENDFRNAEAWFLDMLPAGIGVPSWALRIFVSPAMGVARFHETGDFRQILWGFEDALGSMPLLNLDNILNSWEIANELAAASEAATLEDNVEATSRAQRYLVTAVAALENMLFESAFASMIYQASDEFDRDPYAIPLRDAAGQIMREGVYNTPRRTDALQDNTTPGAEYDKGYVQRTEMDAMLRTLTERRPMLAMVMSLIKQDSTYLRTNMVPKLREVDAEALSVDEAQTVIMSILSNETGQEVPTVDGAEAVVRGIRMGTLRADSPALQGFYIPQEMRAEIQTRVLEELTLKYIDLGFYKSQALSKAKEEFYGQAFGEPEGLGFADILWDDSIIPAYQTQKYMQLNTTYVMGPNNRPIATGIERSTAVAFGLPMFEGYLTSADSNMETDALLNSVDTARQANLGLRGLVKMDESWLTPTPEEIGESIEKALREIGDKLDDMNDALANSYGRSGYSPWGYRSWGRGSRYRSSGGGYSSSPYVADYGGQAQRMNTPRRVRSAYSDDLYSIDTSNPIIRRATIRRERFSSQRGRLNQWQ